MKAKIDREIDLVINQAVEMVNSTDELSKLHTRLKEFDTITYLHSINVARLSIFIGKIFGFSNSKLIDLAISGYMHDIGKIYVGIDIIGKPDKLTEEEFAIVKAHPLLGYTLLSPFLQEDILLGVLEHHERITGDGYVKGLQDKSISLFGRILGAADTFDAMTSIRPYKPALTRSNTVQFMIDSGGFDPDIIDIIKGGFSNDICVLG